MTTQARRPYLALATSILLMAALFRIWQLSTTPPGLLPAELHNAQLADSVRVGEVSVVYRQLTPAQGGLYYVILAASSALLGGKGLILWRLPSVWASLLALSITFSLMRRLLNGRTALLIIALMSVGFWPLWMARAALSVTLMPLVTVLFGYAMLRAFTAAEPEQAGMWFTLGGVGLGLAQYVHVIAWGLLPILLGFTIYLLLANRQMLRSQWPNLVYTLALAAIIFIPMFVSVASHPGLRALTRLSDQPGWQADLPQRILSAVSSFFLSGDPSPQRNVPLRPILDPISGGLFVTGLGIALARWRRASFALLPIWLLLGLIPALLVPQVPHFEHLVLIMPVIYALPALALDELQNRFAKRRYELTLAILLIILGNALWTARDQFIRWPHLEQVRLDYQNEIASLARYLDTDPDRSPVGICVFSSDDTALQAQPAQPDTFALPDDQLLDYFMHRSTATLRKYDCRQALVLAERGATQRIIFLNPAHYQQLPGPLLNWLHDNSDVSIPAVRPGTVRRIEVTQQLAAFIEESTESAPVQFPPEATGDSAPALLPLTFTDNIILETYNVRDATLLGGESVEVTTYWRLVGVPPSRLLLFANLQGGPGPLAAQSQGWGAHLTNLQAQDIIIQYNMLQPADAGPLPVGDYSLAIGLLVPEADYRLRVLAENTPRSERILLQNITITD